jgi:hypothetical protein
MGGLVIPRAALKRQVAGLILLCAGLPPRTLEEHAENYATRNPGNEAHFLPAGDGLITLSLEGAAHDFFNDCPEDVQRQMYAQFRPQGSHPVKTARALASRIQGLKATGVCPDGHWRDELRRTRLEGRVSEMGVQRS